jgi:hypothetical protein
MDTYPVVDRREDIADAYRPTYELGATCEICGERHIAIFSKGHRPTPALDECPHCEVIGMVSYQYAKEAREMRAENLKNEQDQQNAHLALPPPTVDVFDNHGRFH